MDTRSTDFKMMDPVKFRANQLPRVAEKMLCLVMIGHWDGLRKNAENYPDAMFLPVPLFDGVKGDEFKFSALSFAIYTYDLCALEILSKLVVGTERAKSFLNMADELEKVRYSPGVIGKHAKIISEFPKSVAGQFYAGKFAKSSEMRKQHYEKMLQQLRDRSMDKFEEVKIDKGDCRIL